MPPPEASLASLARQPAALDQFDEEDLRDQARAFVRDARAASTLRVYRSDWPILSTTLDRT